MSSSGGESSARRLGRYHLVEPIGGGPTGEVFRAKVYGVAGLERQFAVKRFHTELVQGEGASTVLAQAARAYGNLEHPRIARMQEFGVASGETFVAIEMVEGIDVSRLLSSPHGQGEPLAAGAALAVVKQAARAIGYAHGRGIQHLGICPTNIICQPDGEVKVTDFGFLPPRLPARPADDKTLRARMPYLAPEQLVGEETTAATDVFQLGVVMYELLAGKKPFSGRSTLEISQAIMSGAPPDPPLPEPVLTLLRRALARSPLERFPDAGALADAIEAAMRAAPMPGNTRDIVKLVREVGQQAEQMSSEQMSGAFAFPMPAPPSSAMPPPPPISAPVVVEPASMAPPTVSLGTPAAPAVPTESPLSRALKRGTKPPPIPAVPPPMEGRRTVMGVAPPSLPQIKQPPPGPIDEDAPTRVREGVLGADGEATAHQSSDMTPLPPPLPPDPSLDFELDSDEAPTQTDDLVAALAVEVQAGSSSAQPLPQLGNQPIEVPGAPAEPLPPPPPKQPGGTSAVRGVSEVLMAVAVLAALGAGGFYGYQQLFPETEEGAQPIRRTTKVVPPAAADAAVAVAAVSSDAGTAVAVAAVSSDAGTVAAVPIDAAVVVAAPPIDAAVVVVAAAPVDAAVVVAAPSGKLVISSTPKKAEIYLDGSNIGRTPMTIDATPDRHTVAIIKPGYKLYVGQVDGSGRVDATLAEVTPSNGRAGIKVRCRKKNRYYVILNGEDTGQLCPTERLGVALGEHVVEIYDPVTDTRNTFRANVQETRHSLRVRID